VLQCARDGPGIVAMGELDWDSERGTAEWLLRASKLCSLD